MAMFGTYDTKLKCNNDFRDEYRSTCKMAIVKSFAKFKCIQCEFVHISFFCITCILGILLKLLWGLFDNLEGMFVQRNSYRKFVIVFMLPMLQFPDKQ